MRATGAAGGLGSVPQNSALSPEYSSPFYPFLALSTPTHLTLHPPQPPSILFPCFLTSVQIPLISGYFSFPLSAPSLEVALRGCKHAPQNYKDGAWVAKAVCLFIYVYVVYMSHVHGEQG